MLCPALLHGRLPSLNYKKGELTPTTLRLSSLQGSQEYQGCLMRSDLLWPVWEEWNSTLPDLQYSGSVQEKWVTRQVQLVTEAHLENRPLLTQKCVSSVYKVSCCEHSPQSVWALSTLMGGCKPGMLCRRLDGPSKDSNWLQCLITDTEQHLN